MQSYSSGTFCLTRQPGELLHLLLAAAFVSASMLVARALATVGIIA